MNRNKRRQFNINKYQSGQSVCHNDVIVRFSGENSFNPKREINFSRDLLLLPAF